MALVCGRIIAETIFAARLNATHVTATVLIGLVNVTEWLFIRADRFLAHGPVSMPD